MTVQLSWSELTQHPVSALKLLRSGQAFEVLQEGQVIGCFVPRTDRRCPWIVGVCGASGVGYAAALLRGLVDAGEAVDLIVSRAGKLTILDETGVPFREADWRTGLERWSARCGFAVTATEGDIRCWPATDFTAGPASGSYLTRGMVVAPATTAAVGGIATGLSKDVLQRAAEVTLKERRPLVVVPREAPFTRSTLQHLLALDGLGTVVIPASPGFYAGANDVSQLYAFVAGKILDVLQVPHALMRRWDGTLGAGRHDGQQQAGPPG
jgi:4-hydroxy-3-polyprenylbenzoate decarboxylase